MSQENVEVVQAMIDAWNRRDDAAAQETFDPEVEVEMSLGSVLDGVYRGYDGLAEAMKFWGAFAEFRSDPIEVVPAGDEVFAAMHHSGRGKASGVAVEMENWQVFTVRGGKIVRYRIFGNRDEALEAAGLSE